MKFSEINADSWSELQPYLDTCLIPVSGLTGSESPWEAADKVARTGQWLEPLEQAFRGRTVTMPAFHYDAGDKLDKEKLNRLINQWKKNGFRYVIVISGQPVDLPGQLEADFVIQPQAEEEEGPDGARIRNSIAELWRQPFVKK